MYVQENQRPSYWLYIKEGMDRDERRTRNREDIVKLI